jgi:hypothetical protein
MTPAERAQVILKTALREVDAELWKALKRAEIGERADIMAESDVLERLSRRIRVLLGSDHG